MEFNSQGINQPFSQRIPPPSNFGAFAEQGRRDIGQSLQGFSVYHHHPGQLPPLPPLREAIQVELEKERIRREVIMSEIARRRLLEAEVRRGLMMEKESALQRGGDGFPFGSSPRLEFDSSMRLPLSGARANGRSLEERIALSLEERLYGRYGGGGYDTMQFQRGAVDRRISEGRGKQETTFLCDNTEFYNEKSLSGSKRKAPGVDASELVLDGILKK